LSSRLTEVGPKANFTVRFRRLHHAAKARPGRLRRLGSAVPAARGLPCVARSAGPAHNSLRELRSLRSDRCAEFVHEARCARGQQPCATRRLSCAPQPARPRLCGDPLERQRGNAEVPARDRRYAAGPISGAARSAALGPARVSALRGLARGICPSAAPAGRVASYAARPEREHRSAVGAARRPPQHEALARTAWRETRALKQTFTNGRFGPKPAEPH